MTKKNQSKSEANDQISKLLMNLYNLCESNGIPLIAIVEPGAGVFKGTYNLDTNRNHPLFVLTYLLYEHSHKKEIDFEAFKSNADNFLKTGDMPAFLCNDDVGSIGKFK